MSMFKLLHQVMLRLFPEIWLHQSSPIIGVKKTKTELKFLLGPKRVKSQVLHYVNIEITG